MDLPDPGLITACVAQRWAPGIGDPSVLGWVTVLCYLGTGIACGAAARRGGPDRRFWAVLCVLLLLLAVNKQLDLQSVLTAAGRCLARLQGWHERRGAVQLGFILGLLGVGVAILLGTGLRLRRRLGNVGLALAGFGLLVTFVAVRAAGFHGTDRLIGLSLAGARMIWILELSGIGLIAVNALWLLRRAGPAS